MVRFSGSVLQPIWVVFILIWLIFWLEILASCLKCLVWMALPFVLLSLTDLFLASVMIYSLSYSIAPQDPSSFLCLHQYSHCFTMVLITKVYLDVLFVSTHQYKLHRTMVFYIFFACFHCSYYLLVLIHQLLPFSLLSLSLDCLLLLDCLCCICTLNCNHRIFLLICSVCYLWWSVWFVFLPVLLCYEIRSTRLVLEHPPFDQCIVCLYLYVWLAVKSAGMCFAFVMKWSGCVLLTLDCLPLCCLHCIDRLRQLDIQVFTC